MNLTNFLKQTDALTAQYSTEQLISFIHEIGRVLPEHNREDFLNRLKAAGGTTEKERTIEKEATKDARNDLGFYEMYERVRNNLELIDSQEVEITGILNEEYDDWYHDDSEEFYYQDDSDISDMLAEACEFVHICMDTEKYEEGFEIGNQMFSIKILCSNEYGDEEFSLGDMVYHELLYCNLMQVCLDTAYCAYHAVPLTKRPETLYGVIENTKEKEITLEKIMQYGDEELPDFQDFLTLWIAYLGTKTGKEADRLILEAVGLLNDISAAAGYAETYVTLHPRLYLNILENEKHADANHMAAMGMEAMKVIPKKYIIRSTVALKTAEYIMKANENLSLQKESLLEECYFAAYESNTCALNYLRALLNGCGTEEKREELQKVLASFPVQTGVISYDMFGRMRVYSEREENKPNNHMILLLKFLDGQFDYVLAEGLNEPRALGWTGTFMKQGIALYLLYLYEGQWTGKGIAAMAETVKSAMNFSAEEYWKGTSERNCTNEKDFFGELFLKWKSMMRMEPDIRIRAIERINDLLEKRTEGIMSANRRNHYGECAAYIAALGEVQESLGEAGAKQSLMTAYKDKYPRRNAFRGELRNYGWIDVKKK